MVCDGPYHGFLKHVEPLEQMFWHTAPGLIFCTALYVVYARNFARAKQVPLSEGVPKAHGMYSFTNTLVIIVCWGLFQCFLAWCGGGELGFRL